MRLNGYLIGENRYHGYGFWEVFYDGYVVARFNTEVEAIEFVES